MTPDIKRAIRRSFERAASGYDASALLQQEVARRLAERLEPVRLAPARILDAGCGTGYAFPLLSHRFPDAELLGLDLAHAMLVRAGARQPTASLLDRLLPALRRKAPRLVCGDLEAPPLASDSVDVIWSNLALQWLDEPEQVFRGLRRVLRPGGLLIFSTFGPDTLRELRAAFAGLDEHGHVNRFIDMHDLGDALLHAGYANPVMEMEYLTLTYADLKACLGDLKGIGAHTVLGPRRQGMMGKSEWRRLEDNYEAFRRDGRLPATFEVVYGHAWVGDKSSWEDGRKVIQLKIEQRQAGLR